jgi:peptidyl-prolyl cis-trans isomerase A (cyclophilin A)
MSTRVAALLLALVPALAHAQTAPPATPPDPIASHTITVAEATKGLRGSGPLKAKIDVEQGGKPFGIFTCELYDKQAPKAVANFVGLARGTRPFYDEKKSAWVKRPFYDGLTFVRVIPGFMVQGGDPHGNGTGNAGYTFEDEFSPDLKMDKPGVLAMANSGPATNGSQFIITEAATNWLTGHHTVFGACEPVDLVTKMTKVPVNQQDLPNEPLVIKKLTITRGAVARAKKE